MRQRNSLERTEADLQLKDVELSCLLNVVLELVEMVGGQKVLRGTEIQPVFSPSRARASSKMNFPSARGTNGGTIETVRILQSHSLGGRAKANYHNL